jgi:cation transport ATPase
MSNSGTLARQKRTWWLTIPGLLLTAAVLSSICAWLLIAAPVATLRDVSRHADHFGRVYLHMLGGTAMLFCGAINLYIGATRRHFRHHRLVGRIYLIGGTVAAVLAVVMTLGPSHKSDGTVVFTNMSVSLSVLAVAWQLAAGMAYRAVRNCRYEAHRDWMIRSYVLAWSFVFCRIVSRVPSVAEFGEGQAFIWLSWIAPVLLCEAALQWRAGSARQG